jgi:hypothetical protein
MRFLANLIIGEMIAVTEQWTGPLKPVFLSIPEIAGLMPRVAEDHELLLSARQGSSAETLLRSLSEMATSLDGRHDHLQRAVAFLMEGTREALLGLAPADEALAAQIDDAQERLQPDGLAIVKASYEAEAGNSKQMLKLADGELASVLSKIPVIQGMTMLDLVHQLGDVGAELGAVEQQKSVAAADAKKQTITPAIVQARMRAWVATVKAVLGALDRSTAAEGDVLQIRQPVIDAVDKARDRKLAERNAAKKAAEEGKEPK